MGLEEGPSWKAGDMAEGDPLGGMHAAGWERGGEGTGERRPFGCMRRDTQKCLKYSLLLLYHEKMAVTRAAWIRKKGCNSILGFW